MSRDSGPDRFDSHLVLVGLMGVGKTTIARLVGAQLSLPVRDSDDDIEREQGATVRELAASRGVDEMHELEAQALLDALDDSPPSVIAAAASVADEPRCDERLRAPDVFVVLLRANAELLATRFRSSPHRPWYGVDPGAFLALQANARDPVYRRVADLEIEVARSAPDQVAEAVIRGLETHRP